MLLPLVESLLLESPLPPPPLSIGILLVELPDLEFDLEPDLEVSSSSVVGGSVASGVPVVTVWHLGQYILNHYLFLIPIFLEFYSLAHYSDGPITISTKIWT